MFKITFEEFKKHIGKIVEVTKLIDNLCQITRGTDLQLVFPTLGSEVIDLLAVLTNDVETDWIGYWCWELQFGELYEDGMITDGNSEIIKMKTIEDLWKVLVDNERDRVGRCTEQ